MEWMDLEVFMEVSSVRSMRKAADNLHLALSAVSTRMKKLEEELGFPLFERTSRGVKMTSQGEVFLEFASSAHAILQAGISRIRRDKPLSKVRIGVTSPLTSLVLPLFMEYLQTAFAGMVLNIVTMESRQIIRGIRSGELHAGILSSAEPISGVRSQILFEQDFWLVSPAQLSSRLKLEGPSIPFPLLPSLPFVLPNELTSLRGLISDMFLRVFSKKPEVIAETDSTILLLKMVEMNIGCTILTLPAFHDSHTLARWLERYVPSYRNFHMQSLSPLFPKRPVFFVFQEHAALSPPNAQELLDRIVQAI